MTVLIALLGAGFTGMGVWAALDPATFPAADFAPFNKHLIHDVAATFLAFGVGLLLAARLVAWRTPVLTLAAVWNTFHAVSHIIDVDRADTHAHGVTAAVELTAVAVLCAGLAWASAHRGGRR